jgi:hypothetical protein
VQFPRPSLSAAAPMRKVSGLPPKPTARTANLPLLQYIVSTTVLTFMDNQIPIAKGPASSEDRDLDRHTATKRPSLWIRVEME